MRAAVRDRYGPPEVVLVEDVETPIPTGDQVLVRVHASSISRADLDGLYPRWQPDLATLGKLVQENTLRPVIDTAYPLDEIIAALRHVETGRTRGKVVVTVAG